MIILTRIPIMPMLAPFPLLFQKKKDQLFSCRDSVFVCRLVYMIVLLFVLLGTTADCYFSPVLEQICKGNQDLLRCFFFPNWNVRTSSVIMSNRLVTYRYGSPSAVCWCHIPSSRKWYPHCCNLILSFSYKNSFILKNHFLCR